MDSPFEQHLGTNYAPTINEMRQIEDLMTASSQKARDMDKEIEKVQRQLDLLTEKRMQLDHFTEQHRALMSPARRLTHDVVAQIFIACLPDGRNPCMSAKEAPILLTRICRSWRALALATPRIWAAIHIVLPNLLPGRYTNKSSSEEQEKLVLRNLHLRQAAAKEWFDRSGICPLSVSVHEIPFDLGAASNYVNFSLPLNVQPTFPLAIRESHRSFIQDTIVRYHKRWASLELQDHGFLMGDVLESGLNPGSLKMLKKFQVTHPAFQLVKHQFQAVISLLPPHLTSATLHGIPLCPSDVKYIELHKWHQLTELDFSPGVGNGASTAPSTVTVDLDALSIILSQCQNLKILKLDKYDANPRDDTMISQYHGDIVLQKLETLKLSMLPVSPKAIAFIKRLNLPILKEFEFQFNSDTLLGWHGAEELLRSLLSSNEFYSLKVNISAPMVRETDLACLLRIAPNLKCFTLCAIATEPPPWLPLSPFPIVDIPLQNVINDELITALTPSGKEYSEIICPDLQELEIHPKIITGITETALKNFIKARKCDTRVASLRRLSLAVNDVKSNEDLEDTVSLGKDSAIYFRKHLDIRDLKHLSPYFGTEAHPFVPKSPFLEYDVYREL